MNQRLLRSVRLLFIGLDVLILNLILLLGKLWYNKYIPNRYDIEYHHLIIFMNIAWLGISWIKNLYRTKYIASFEQSCRKTMHVYAYFMVISILYLYFYRKTEISRLFIGAEFIAISIGFFINRLINLALFQYFLKKNFVIRKVLIIGYNQTSKKLANYLEEEPVNTEIVGYCEEEENVNELSNYPIVSKLSNVMNFCKHYGHVTEIYSTISPEQNHYIYQLMQEADQECIRFKIIPDLNFYIKLPIYINYFKDIPVLSIRKEPLDNIADRVKKRIFDLCISAGVTLFILSWMIPIIGLLIWIEDRGPIFFIQKRSGKNNKDFNCIKFRSMRINTEANLRQATKDDQRITRIGKILRKTSLDEFPQFLNVFMGHMSLVGPRPHMLKHTNEYSKLIRQYMIRHFAKPGVTGWAQINGCRGEIKIIDDMKRRVEYDLWYLENWNLWLDTKFIFLTIYILVFGDKNAY
jgi:putative colanic acid biosynthesis UDP-glucose lipid carrier transferase